MCISFPYRGWVAVIINCFHMRDYANTQAANPIFKKSTYDCKFYWERYLQSHALKLRSHTMKSLKAFEMRLFILLCRTTALKRFNDIVTIMTVIVFLVVIAMLSMISLCVIAALTTSPHLIAVVLAFT